MSKETIDNPSCAVDEVISKKMQISEDEALIQKEKVETCEQELKRIEREKLIEERLAKGELIDDFVEEEKVEEEDEEEEISPEARRIEELYFAYYNGQMTEEEVSDEIFIDDLDRAKREIFLQKEGKTPEELGELIDEARMRILTARTLFVKSILGCYDDEDEEY